MSKPSSKPAPTSTGGPKRSSPVLNYSLRPAKNIERKMMGEAFARLARLCPLSRYRYIGFGSEFFNDFALYHETLGIRDMVSIEHHIERVARCDFNRPYKCIKVLPGTASEVLPNLKWEPRSIIWLDYLDKLERSVLEDVRFVVSAASSGSMLVLTVNSHPWGDSADGEDSKRIPASELSQHRERKLRESLLPTIVPEEWLHEPLAKWGLARVYYKLLREEIDRVLSDRNVSAMPAEKLVFHQCFHFRYADGQRMLTVGGVLLNPADAATLGDNPFAGLPFIRNGADATELKLPVLTGREVRHLSRLFPHDRKKTKTLKWLAAEDIENFRQVYRYYPVYAESEL
jgi:hypothetical protein